MVIIRNIEKIKPNDLSRIEKYSKIGYTYIGKYEKNLFKVMKIM